MVDSRGGHPFDIEVTEVAIVRLADVPLAHAVAEGEGYATVEEWRSGHEGFWSSAAFRAEIGEGYVVDDDTFVVLENFRVLR